MKPGKAGTFFFLSLFSLLFYFFSCESPTGGGGGGGADVTAPVLSGGTLVRTGETTAVISFTTDEAGTAYYLVLANGAEAPVSEDVIEGTSLGAVTVGANTGKAVTVTAAASDIYLVVEDAAGNISAPLKIEADAFDPDDTKAPVLSGGSVNRTSDTAATIDFSTDEAGTAYYLVLSSGAEAPANTAVREGTSLGAVTVGANTGKAVTVTAAASDIYLVVEDAAGNISAVLLITVAAFDPGDDGDANYYGTWKWNFDEDWFDQIVLSADSLVFSGDEGGGFSMSGLDWSPVTGHISSYHTGYKITGELSANSGLYEFLKSDGSDLTVTLGEEVMFFVYLHTSKGAIMVGFGPGFDDGTGGPFIKLGFEGDLTPPELSDGDVTRTSHTAATISFTSDEAGTAYCLVTEPSEDYWPTIDEVRAGTSLGPVTVGANTRTVTLTTGAWEISIVVEDSSGNISYPLYIYADEYDDTVPELSLGSVNRTSDTAATINFISSKAGTAYYVQVPSGESAPTSDAVKAVDNNLGAVTSEANIGIAVTLTSGARDIYVVVEDAAGNVSAPLKIEAAAYVLDTTAPVLSAGSVNRTSNTAATINYSTDEAGTAYYVQISSGATAPTGAEVKAANNSLGAAALGANTGKPVTLTEGARDIYVVVEDAANNISVPLKIEAAAYVPPDIIPPVLSGGSVDRTSDTAATIEFTTDEAGTAYYLVLASTAAAPANTVVKNTGTSTGAAALGPNTKAVILIAGAVNIYVVVEDAAGNISAVLTIPAAAYVPPDITPPVLSGGSVNRTSDTAATISFITDEAGTAYYVELASGAGAPTSAVVRAGTSLGAAIAGPNTGKTITLTAGDRDIYIVVEDAATNISAPLKIEAEAFDSDTTAPSLSAGSINRTSNTAATITFSTDEAGTAYYVRLASGDPAPAGAAVKSTGTSLSAVVVGPNSKPVTLTAGPWDIYVVVEDSAGNISAPLKIEAPAYVPAVNFNSVSANGSSGTTTTILTLTFSAAITGLDADDIALSGVSGMSKGTLLGPVSGTVSNISPDSTQTYTLPISGFSAGGTLSATVTKEGYNITGSPGSVTIYYSSGSSGLPSQEGLYLGAPASLLTTHAPIDVSSYTGTYVGTTIVDRSLAYINANATEYTLLIDDDVSLLSTFQSRPIDRRLNRTGVKLTVIGLGTERQISLPAGQARNIFIVGEGTYTEIALTLGNNITLMGNNNNDFSLVLVQNAAAFTMLPGSKITGNTSSSNMSSNQAAVSVNGGSSFTMEGGSITGNNTTANNTTNAINAVGAGLYATGGGTTITLNGGSITGNTTMVGNTSPVPGDVYVTSAINSITVSGTAALGVLTLSAGSATVQKPLTVNSGWTGTVSGLNLYGVNSVMDNVINYWLGKAVLVGPGVIVTTVGRVTRGNFITESPIATQAISPRYIDNDGILR
ncbi:MAG: hypothetical protein FWG99_09195 [Treponema sp.]|nr:hypothetical protein [Treponema sp.]